MKSLKEAFIDIGAPHFDHPSLHSEAIFSEKTLPYFAPVCSIASFRALAYAAGEKTRLLNQKFRGNPRKAEPLSLNGLRSRCVVQCHGAGPVRSD